MSVKEECRVMRPVFLTNEEIYKTLNAASVKNEDIVVGNMFVDIRYDYDPSRGERSQYYHGLLQGAKAYKKAMADNG